MNSRILIAFVFFLVFSSGVFGFSRSDFLQHVETRVDITSAYSQYRVCNPAATDFSVDSVSDFSVSFNEARGDLKSYKFTRLESVPYSVDDFTESCSDEVVTVPASPENGTDAYTTTVRNCHMERDGSHTEYRDEWVEFSPVGASFRAGECYDIRVEGTFAPSYGEDAVSIDNVVDYAGFSFGEYAWWNASWTDKVTVNVGNLSSLSASTATQLKILLNSSVVDYGATNNDGSDIRCVNGTDNGELGIFIEYWNESGTSIIYCGNVTINQNINSTIYVYYGNVGASTASNFTKTFNGLQAFYSWNENNNSKDQSNNNIDLSTSSAPSYVDLSDNQTEISFGAEDFEKDNNQHLNSAASESLEAASFTVTYWQKLESNTVASLKRVVSTNDVNGGNQYGWYTNVYPPDEGRSNETHATFYCGSGGNGDIVQSGVKEQIGVWYHYTIIWNSATNDGKIYVNGVDSSGEVSEGGCAIAYQSDTNTRLDIGSEYYNSAWIQPHDGIMDEVRYYNRILSADEIKLLYDQPDYVLIPEEDSEGNVSANETEGRTAIEQGVLNILGSGYITYTNQQMYVVHWNGTHKSGLFDKVVAYSDKRWAFNYDQNSSAGFTGMFNLTPVFYVLEMYNSSTSTITSTVEQLINQTKN